MKTEPWALILAGGDGWRLQPLTETITGGPRPKQFCPLMEGETLLDHTRRRADLLVRGDRQVVVVTRKHEAHYQYLREELAPGRLVVQPANRGTGPGIVYPLLRILELAGLALSWSSEGGGHAAAQLERSGSGTRTSACARRSTTPIGRTS
jgi:mannose-1-phosphate guanylyltransferase